MRREQRAAQRVERREQRHGQGADPAVVRRRLPASETVPGTCRRPGRPDAAQVEPADDRQPQPDQRIARPGGPEIVRLGREAVVGQGEAPCPARPEDRPEPEPECQAQRAGW